MATPTTSTPPPGRATSTDAAPSGRPEPPDPVEEWGVESFPASDPPQSWSRDPTS